MITLVGGRGHGRGKNVTGMNIQTAPVNSLWVNKRTGQVIRVLTAAGGAHRYLTVQGTRRYRVSLSGLHAEYAPVDDEWIAHAPEGTVVPDLEGRLWTRDGCGQWYCDSEEYGRFSSDLRLWSTDF